MPSGIGYWGSFLFQVSAYGEAFDSSIKVEVFGDMEAARKLITKEEEPRADIYSESDNEQDQQEVRIKKSWRWYRKPTPQIFFPWREGEGNTFKPCNPWLNWKTAVATFLVSEKMTKGDIKETKNHLLFLFQERWNLVSSQLPPVTEMAAVVPQVTCWSNTVIPLNLLKFRSTASYRWQSFINIWYTLWEFTELGKIWW